MSTETTVRAIVLRRKDQGESDRRLTLFTAELGKLDVLAKGARKATSRLKSVSEPLAVADFTFAPGKKQRFVTQAQPLGGYRELRSDFDRLNLALSWTELLAVVLPYEEPFYEAYELCDLVLRHLSKHPKPKVAMTWGEIKLLETTGFLPSFRRCIITDAPVQESEAFLSPSAGGYVVREEAGEYRDRFIARSEVLLGLHALTELDAPPNNLKFVDECLQALQPFWLNISEAPLPARKHLLESLAIGS
jgi:DNA repair protein RecO (recombination protein O)